MSDLVKDRLKGWLELNILSVSHNINSERQRGSVSQYQLLMLEGERDREQDARGGSVTHNTCRKEGRSVVMKTRNMCAVVLEMES